MPRSSESPRTTRVTDFAYLEKNVAAWPAELAPPTMKTSASTQAAASVAAEP